MELEPFDSTCISEAGWEKGDLEIHFTDGLVYTYHSVSPLVWANLLRCSSPGWFFNKYIRNRYSWN